MLIGTEDDIVVQYCSETLDWQLHLFRNNTRSRYMIPRKRICNMAKPVKQLAKFNSIVLSEDDESRREEAEAKRLIQLHLLHSGFAEESQQAGNKCWTNAEVEGESVVVTRGRRSGQHVAVSGFAKDVVTGLTSDTFCLDNNIVTGDERRGLDEEVCDEVRDIMEHKRCSFDDARLELTRRKMREAGVDPDTGMRPPH
jgi:hypothetical protein